MRPEAATARLGAHHRTAALAAGAHHRHGAAAGRASAPWRRRRRVLWLQQPPGRGAACAGAQGGAGTGRRSIDDELLACEGPALGLEPQLPEAVAGATQAEAEAAAAAAAAAAAVPERGKQQQQQQQQQDALAAAAPPAPAPASRGLLALNVAAVLGTGVLNRWVCNIYLFIFVCLFSCLVIHGEGGSTSGGCPAAATAARRQAPVRRSLHPPAPEASALSPPSPLLLPGCCTR